MSVYFNKVLHAIEVTLAFVWSLSSSAVVVTLLLSRYTPMVRLFPDVVTGATALGESVAIGDRHAKCFHCGLAMQIVDNNMLTSMNPFYGLRTLFAFDDSVVSPQLNSARCWRYPCTPGCQGLVDEYSIRINVETRAVFNRTIEAANAIGVSVTPFLGSATKPVPSAINRDAQWLDHLFTMLSEEERDLAPDPGYPSAADDEAPILSNVPPHRHQFNFRGRCVTCGRVLTEEDCKGSDIEHSMRVYLDSRQRNSPKHPCASCGIQQDYDQAGLARDPSSAPSSEVERTSMWYTRFPTNADHHKACHDDCEGVFSTAGQYRVALWRLITAYNLRGKMEEVRALPLPYFLFVFALFLLLTGFSPAMTEGNLEWRESLYGVMHLPLDAYTPPAAARPPRSAAAVVNNRSRRR